MLGFLSTLSAPAKIVLVVGLIQVVLLIVLMLMGSSLLDELKSKLHASISGMDVAEIVAILGGVIIVWTIVWAWILNMIYHWNSTVAWVILIISLLAPAGFFV